MIQLERTQFQTGIIIIGIAIAVFGFSIHFLTPSKIGSGSPTQIDATSYAIENINFGVSDAEYSFRFFFRHFGFQNLSVYILNTTEYDRFSNGTVLNELDVIASYPNTTDFQWEPPMIEDLDIYLIISNNNTYSAMCGYYFMILPSMYFDTLSIGFIGVFMILIGLIWYLTGWRRYLIIGVAINLVLFYLRIFTFTSDRLPFPELFGIPFVFDWFIEPYNDYQFFYLRWTSELWGGTWPYSLDPFSGMSDYIYPPLWIYTISLLGTSSFWSSGLILFAFNMATGVIVYAISYELTNDEKRSIFAMLLFLLNPFILFYGSFLWLNPTPYVFFVTLSFYLALNEKGSYSILMLAVATLYKQFAVIFFPLLLLVLFKRGSQIDIRSKLISITKHCILYAAVIGLVSIPFLLVNFDAYISQLLLRGYTPEFLATFHYQPSWPLTFNTFFLWIGAPEWITWSIAYLLACYVLLLLSSILIYIVYARTKYNEQSISQDGAHSNNRVFTEVLFWCILLVLVFQIFFPRGTYKFYLMILIPFISIFFDYRDVNLKNAKEFSIQRYYFVPLIISWVVFLCFRLVYFWILLGWAIFYLWKRNRLTYIRAS
ncbi:MAG: hypothetical protein RTU92_04670 [Candidatus Thorarchaeota archaeon]